MNICIVGWYGTETLGDRAILDGIISVFQDYEEKNKYFIGSLFPILTERTIFEDKDIFESHIGEIELNVFDIREKKEFLGLLKKCNILIMGGGPLMDIREMYFIESAFKYAKKNSIKTLIFGCGYGPLNTTEFKNVLKKIVRNSDMIIMRSKKCKESIELLTSCKAYSLCDPAIISVAEFSQKNIFNDKTNKNLICNFRDIDYVYSSESNTIEKIANFIDKNSNKFDKIILYPMHTFSVGGDDRYFLNKIKEKCQSEFVSVINKPLSLLECYEMISKAYACVGMRYHSIIFQTILNGNNYLIDYTNQENGKIKSLMDEYSMLKSYKNRYINILNNNIENFCLVQNDLRYSFDLEQINKDKQDYLKLLKCLFKEKNF